MSSLDELPPDVRFLLRARHAGLPLADGARMLCTDEKGAVRRLRAAAGTRAPPVAAGTKALLDVLTRPPLHGVDLAAAAPARDPATPCPPDRVVRDLALGRLAGPHVLVTAEHAADCRHCLVRVLEAPDRPELDQPPDAPASPRERPDGLETSLIVLFVVAALIAALAALVLLLRLLA